MSGASDKTEKPTAKRLKDAREKGQVVHSRDLTAALSLAAMVLAMGFYGPTVVAAMTQRLGTGIARIGDRPLAQIAGGDVSALLWADGTLLVTIVGPLALIAAFISVLGSVVQTGWNFAPKALQLNFERLSLSAGFKKLTPLQASPDVLKAFVGVAAIGGVAYMLVRGFIAEAPILAAMSPVAAARTAWEQSWSLLWRASLALTALAGGDYALQRFRFMKGNKMTRQEVRDESKQNEVNPEIKQRVRKVQREMTRRRMLQAVKKATVVVTNPTHFAVALEYRRKDMPAPIVLAKGQDLMAGRIRKIAREHGVPIVENVTLARALYAGAEVGDTIPAALFGAVAEVLAYLVRLKQLLL